MSMRRGLAVLTALLALPAPAAAQAQLPSWFSIDTTAAVDRAAGLAATPRLASCSTPSCRRRIGPGLEIYTRPFVQRLGTGEWNRQVWLAAARYERKGAVGLRIEGGLIPGADRARQPDAAAAAQPDDLAAGVAVPGPAAARTLQPARHAARRHLSLRRQRHGVGHEMGRPRGADRRLAAARAPHLRRHQSAPFRQRGRGRRRDADRRPAVRSIGDARRLEARRRTAGLQPRRSTRRS